MTKKRSAINFDKTIFGINFTERGPQSISKSFKIGPVQFTVNARESGIRGSVGIPVPALANATSSSVIYQISEHLIYLNTTVNLTCGLTTHDVHDQGACTRRC